MSSVIVYGGNGALGACIVNYFKQKDYEVISIDVADNAEASINIAVDPNDSWTDQETQILHSLTQQKVDKVRAIFCVAGGWAGGNAADVKMVENADKMWRQSVFSSAIAARIAAVHLAEGGVLQLTGAAGALSGTPGMIGYGMAKAAVHQLTKSLAEGSSGLPSSSNVFAILPVVLDTPMNRKFMPNMDFSKWTPLEFIARQFYTWVTEPTKRPTNGALLVFETNSGETTIEEKPL